MEKEDQIIGMLEQVMDKQNEHSNILTEHTRILNEHGQKMDEHSQKLDEHTRILNEHGQKLDEHSRILGEHSEKLDEQTKILGEHGDKLEIHSSHLSEHGQILSALLTGDHLKADIDGMKVSNAKEFGAIKEEISKVSSNQEHLSKFTWKNMEDIHQIKNKLGMR